MSDPDDPAAAAAAALKGQFEFPENSVDLIGMFLDPDIRAARIQINRQIDRRNDLDPMAKSVGKALAGIQAIQIQANRQESLSQEQHQALRSRMNLRR